MDFHSLTRRELQTLCKKNKIPANITNVAMADALKALEIVEGIEEFLQSCQSETAESSIESPVRSEVTSPYVPPTGGRSTRRRNVVKEEPETAKPMTRTRRTTQKTLVRDADRSHADAVETPAVVVQTGRKKGPMTSACRKMDSEFKECIHEEKKDASMTPSQLGVTTRKRRGVKEGSAVNVVYSTRRSVRLAKKNMELLNEEDIENSGLFKKDLFNKDGQNLAINLKESSANLDEISEITGLDANTSVEKKSEGNDEVEVVSAIKQDVPIADEGEPVSSTEEEKNNDFETDVSKPEVKEGSDVEIEEVGSCFETEAEPDEKKCDNTVDSEDQNMFMPLNASSRIQESEVENTAELNTEEVEVDEDKAAGGEVDEDKASNYIENVVLESEDHLAVGEVACDADICNEIEKEICNGKNMDSEGVSDIEVNDEVLTTNAEAPVAVVEKVFNSDETSDLAVLEAMEGPTKMAGMEPLDISLINEEDEAKMNLSVPNWNNVIADLSESWKMNMNVSNWNNVIADLSESWASIGEKNQMNMVKATKIELLQGTEEVLPGTKLADVAIEEPVEIEVVQSEESTKVLHGRELDDVAVDESGKIDAVQSEESTEVLPGTELDDVAVEEPGGIDAVQSEESTKVTHQHPPSFAGLDSCVVVQPSCLTPVKGCASKASATKKMTAVSDNKENIGSGSKLVLTKERVMAAKNTGENVGKLDDLSMQKLKKMLKKKLEMTNKMSKDEEENNEAPHARPALKALDENR
ncbi:UNVERIFIED_CONTAM: hypothetical protein Sradi_6322600 [Sesamum radiatum]|uniref:Uncharacterized protein n=1 Tax=Sesamum radiatum TaxID=300843 RepID=A0AAW2KCH4_SESRA